MNYIKNSYIRHSKLYNSIFLNISICITLGLIISLCLDNELITNMYKYFIDHINNFNSNIFSNILYPIIIYIFITLVSLTLLGSFIPFFAISIENMSIGLILGILVRKSALKGLLFGIIYFLITKFLYIIILIYLVINIYKFIKTLFNSLKNKNNDSIYNLYSKILLKLLFSIIAITAYNLLNIFLAPKIIKLFIFLL